MKSGAAHVTHFRCESTGSTLKPMTLVSLFEFAIELGRTSELGGADWREVLGMTEEDVQELPFQS